MLPAALALLALLASSGASAPRDEDVALRLAELGSPVAADRARAERWLAAHLRRDDLPLVARAAAGGDAEARRRLGRAVGAEDRLLGLAAALAADADPVAAAVGRDAVREIALAWTPGLDAPPLVGDELAVALQRSVAERSLRLLRVDLAAPLEDVLDLLRRSGEVPLNLVVDPRIADRVRGRAAAEELPYVAAWSQLLPVLAGVHGLVLESVGLGGDGELPGGAFVVFRAPVAPGQPGAATLAPVEAGETGAARLQRWVREVATVPEAGAGPLAAATRRGRIEALLTTGWPAAWTWIGALDAAGDATAGEALLAGAAAGVWPPTWRSAERVTALLERLRLVQAPGFEREAGRVARALAAAPALLADGTAVPALFGAAWSGAGDAERRQLLVALEGIGAPGEPAQVAAWEARLRTLLARPAGGASPALLRQALRAWCALLVPHDVAPPELGAPLEVLGADAPWSAAERREVASLLARSGARPPDAWDGLPPLGAAEAGPLGARVTLVAWLAAAGRTERAAELVAATAPAAGAAAALGDVLERMARRGDPALARAVLGSAGDGAHVERVALLAGPLAGPLAPDRRAELCREIAAAEPPDHALLGVAAGVAGPAGVPARERAVRLLEEALTANAGPREILPVLEAIERAMADLLRAGEDAEASELRRDAAVRVYGAPRGAMRDRLATSGWPAFPPELEALPLELLRRP